MAKQNEIYDIDAERYSIAGLLKNPKVLADLPLQFSENAYRSKLYSNCFSAIREAAKEGEDINPYLIATRISNLGMSFEELSGGSLLEHLEEIKVGVSLTEEGTLDFCRRLAKIEVFRERFEAAKNVGNFLREKKNWEKPLEDIITYTDQLYEGNISLYTRDGGKEFSFIFDTVEAMMEERAANPITEFGYFSPFDRFNHLYDALYTPSDINATASRSNVGKAQDINCKVLTPMGWKRIGEIEFGDFVIGSDGQQKKVLGVYPQGLKKSFKVTVDDGGFTYSCDEHLWLTTTYKNRKNKTNKQPTVKSLKEITETLVDNHGLNFVKPVQFNGQKLPLNPYLLGVLIGDGCLTERKSTVFTTADDEILDFVLKSLPESDEVRKVGEGDKYSYRIVRADFEPIDNISDPRTSTTQRVLKEIGLHGLKSYEKFIPDLYKYSKVEDRISLLRGLMDTDGNIDKGRPSVTFNSTSERLARDVREIAWSLGARASIKERKNTYYTKNGEKVFCRNLWRVYITFQRESGINPFQLKRKEALFKGGKKKKYRYIKSVELVGEVKSVCIKIDSPDSLYVTDSYILTHNTSYGFFLASHVCDKYQVPSLWMDSGEMTEHQMAMRAICSFSKGVIPTYYLKTGLWKQVPEMAEAYEKIRPRIERLKKTFAFRNVGGMTSAEICSVIRRFWLTHVGRFSETIPSFGSKLGPCFPTTYDYLKPMPGDNPNAPEWATMGYHLQDLKNLITSEVPTGINTFLQLNKGGITRGKMAGQYDDSENSWGMSDRIYHNVSRGESLRFKTLDELAEEGQKFGNCVLKNVKRRDLGKGFKEALTPVKMPDGSLRDNYLHLNQESFYWECLGDLASTADDMGQVASEDKDDNDDGDVNLV